MRTACALMVMPLSRSSSMLSSNWSTMSRGSTAPVACSNLSASVDLPWSTCAMMQKLRIESGSIVSKYIRATPNSDEA